MSNIVVIGAGRIGKAIGHEAQACGHQVDWWDAIPNVVEHQRPLSEIIPLAELVIFSIPSWTMRDGIASIQPFLKSDALVLSFAKGVEHGSLKFMDEILSELLPHHAFGIVGGPMLAEEIEQKHGGVAAIGVTSDVAAQHICETFRGSQLRFEWTTDVRGVALSGVLKNVYALACGIIDGLGWQSNRKGWFVANATREIARVGEHLGGKPETFYHSFCLADLIACCYSPFSKNRHTGEEIIRTGKIPNTTESARSFEPLIQRIHDLSSFTILRTLEDILVRHKPASEAFEAFYQQEAPHG